jgi:hypothetical protein
VAAHLGRGPVEVTLRAPTPLDVPVELRAADDRATLSRGDDLLVSARRVSVRLRSPRAVTPEAARDAATRFVGWEDHAFPTCFVCGTDRAEGEGLRLFTGPVAGRPGTVAGMVTPLPGLGDAGGRVRGPGVWAMLDCPSAWVDFGPDKVAMLGRMTAQVRGEVRAGASYVAVAELVGVEGRRMLSRSALFDVDGRCLALAATTWVRLKPPT